MRGRSILSLAICAIIAVGNLVHADAESLLFEAMGKDDTKRIEKIKARYFNDIRWRDILFVASRNQTILHIAANQGSFKFVELLREEIIDHDDGKNLFVDALDYRGRTPLFYAAYSANSRAVKVAEKLIDLGANISWADNEGFLAIHAAIDRKNLEVTNLLLNGELDKGVVHNGRTLWHFMVEKDFYNFLDSQAANMFDISAIDSQGQTPICTAAILGKVEFGRKILSKFSPIYEGKCKMGQLVGPPLQAAAFSRQKDYVEMLLKKNSASLEISETGATALHVMAAIEWRADIDPQIISLLYASWPNILDARDKAGQSPFLVAAAHSSIDFASFLTQTYKVNMSAKANDGQGALHQTRSVEFADYLIKDCSIEINVTAGPKQLNPLHVAVLNKKDRHFFFFLIKNGADRNGKAKEGKTAMHFAIDVNNLDALGWMLEAQTEFDFLTMDEKQRTPLLYAIDIGNVEAAMLIARSLPIDNISNQVIGLSNDTAMHLAALKNMHALVQELVKQGLSIDTPNAIGKTPLHNAVILRSYEIAVALVNQKASAASQDSFGRTPLHYAVRSDEMSARLVGLVMKSPTFDVELRDKLGETPLEAAIRLELGDVVDMLLSKYNASCSATNRFGISPLNQAKRQKLGEIVTIMKNTGKCSDDSQMDKCKQDDEGFIRKVEHCKNRPFLLNADIEKQEHLTCTGTTLRFSCKRSYTLIGIDEISCNDAGHWEAKGFCAGYDDGRWIVNGQLIKVDETALILRNCEQMFRIFPSAPSGSYDVISEEGVLNKVVCNRQS